MKKKTSKIVATLLIIVMMLTALCGCRGFMNNSPNSNVPEESTVADSGHNSNTGNNKEEQSQSATDLMENLRLNFEQTTPEESYNQAMLNLPDDYVFEFECSEEAGMYAYEAFSVYNSPDLANVGGIQFNTNTYENGKIIVAPGYTLHLEKESSAYMNDGTWGNLNELYLVQYLDLETGNKLERPIVTPFTVEHDLQAPVITQGVDENNCYMLSWEAIPGAVEYRIYEHYLDSGYYVECVTTENTVSADEFQTQKESDEFMELFYQDLEDSGYPEHVTNQDGVVTMNRAVKYDDELESGYFLVVAVGADGEQSGISNIVNVRDIASQLPYEVVDSMVEVNIETVEDAPAYVDVRMVDGSVQQMIIDYHGAQLYEFLDDPNKIGIQAHVANTLFNRFFVVLSGLTPEEVINDSYIITERQDDLLSKIGGTQNPEINVSYTPSEELTNAIDAFREEMSGGSNPSTNPDDGITEPSEEPSSDSGIDLPDVSTDSASEQVKLMNEVKVKVQDTINTIGSERIGDILYAGNDMEAWMAMCLIAQSEIIPVPVEVFPEAANINYVSELFLEAYRQNPICGVLIDIEYSPEYQALVVKYAEAPEVRMDKIQKELDAAYALNSQIINPGMSDYEKVLAINEYFRLHASYDYDSTQTGRIEEDMLTEQFIDSHTPYGVLCNNYGVCESYSEAFVVVARIAGLDAICEIGTIYGGGHEWNRVKIDGSWCVLDITNNDIDVFTNSLMNVTDEQIAGILVPDHSAFLNYTHYAATDPTKEYYYVNGWSVTDLSQADEILAEQLETSNYAVIRIPANVEKSEIGDILKALIYEQEVNYADAGVKLNLLYVEK